MYCRSHSLAKNVGSPFQIAKINSFIKDLTATIDSNCNRKFLNFINTDFCITHTIGDAFFCTFVYCGEFS